MDQQGAFLHTWLMRPEQAQASAATPSPYPTPSKSQSITSHNAPASMPAEISSESMSIVLSNLADARNGLLHHYARLQEAEKLVMFHAATEKPNEKGLSQMMENAVEEHARQRDAVEKAKEAYLALSKTIAIQNSGFGGNNLNPAMILPIVNSLHTAPDSIQHFELQASPVIANIPDLFNDTGGSSNVLKPKFNEGPPEVSAKSLGKRKLESTSYSNSEPKQKFDCLHPECSRKGLKGFTRKDNLKVHMQTVHKGWSGGAPHGQGSSAQSAVTQATTINQRQHDVTEKHDQPPPTSTMPIMTATLQPPSSNKANSNSQKFTWDDWDSYTSYTQCL